MFGVVFSMKVIFGQARNITKSIDIKNEEDLLSDIKDVRMRPRMIKNKKSSFYWAFADHIANRGNSIKSFYYFFSKIKRRVLSCLATNVKTTCMTEIK